MQGLAFRGRPPIRIAASVQDVVNLENPYAEIIMNRGYATHQEIVDSILCQSIFGWEGRNPAPALDSDGNFQGTDLDLLSFLVGLTGRSAVIEIPQYRNRRKIVQRTNERKIGTNQFGSLMGLTSHKKVLSFSVRIFDQTIAKTNTRTGREKLGAPRNYMIVDCDGHWYEGWNRIVWKPDVAENEFLTRCGLWTDNTVRFTHYIHPNRVNAIFGAPYLLLKMLVLRLDDEAKFYRNEMKRLKTMKRLGAMRMGNGENYYISPTAKGPVESIRVKTIEVLLDTPDFTGAYIPVSNTQRGLEQAYKWQKFLTYTLKPRVQFVIRADEAAYFLHGAEDNYIAPWMKGREWKSGYKPPRGRVEWNQMVLSHDVALRFRLKEVAQEVSAL